MSDELWPCQRDPERWFSLDRGELGKAIHACRRHCSRLRECGLVEEPPMDGVLAGELYTTLRVVDCRQPPEVLCVCCTAALPAPPQRRPRAAPGPGCGSHSGYSRHIRLLERPCLPCATAHNRYRAERRRRAVA